MKVKCINDYYGDPSTRFFIWKGEVKELPEELSPELEQALDQGLLIEVSDKEKMKDEK